MLTFEKVLEIFADYLTADAVSYTHLPAAGGGERNAKAYPSGAV